MLLALSTATPAMTPQLACVAGMVFGKLGSPGISEPLQPMLSIVPELFTSRTAAWTFPVTEPRSAKNKFPNLSAAKPNGLTAAALAGPLSPEGMLLPVPASVEMVYWPEFGAAGGRTTRPILFTFSSVNQSAPSGPSAIPKGRLKGVGGANCVITPAVVIRPIVLLSPANQRAPSGPVVIPKASMMPPTIAGIANSVTAPAVVMRPIRLNPGSVNQSAPSGPNVIPKGVLPPAGIWNSLNVPAVAIRPILPAFPSVNQSAPSGPAVIPLGKLFPVGTANSVRLPPVVMRPILFPTCSVNHNAPSGPAVIPPGWGNREPGGIGNVLTAPAVVMRPIRLPTPPPPFTVNHNAPSGPRVIPKGELPAGGTWKLLTTPAM